MLCLCRPLSSRFLLLVSSVQFPHRLKRAGLFAWLPFFVQLDLVRDRLKRAGLFSSGFRFYVQLDLARDRLKRANLYSPEFRFLVQLDLVHNRLKFADLYSPGFLFLVQLDLVCRSTEARRLTRLAVNSKLVA